MYFYPGSTFTGVTGTTYTAATQPQDISSPDIRLALLNGWTQADTTKYPGILDVPMGSQNLIYQAAIPFVIAPTGTMGNNGAITLGTALDQTYPNVYLYLTAGAIATSSAAGWYYAVMSSATAGIVYNTTYSSGKPYIPGTLLAFSTTGPGAYTGVTTAVTGPSATLASNALGVYGVARIYGLFSFKGSTNNKTVALKLGSSSLFSVVQATAANIAQTVDFEVFNQGSAALQVCNGAGVDGVSTVAHQFFTVDTTAATTIAFSGTLATATDWIKFDALSVRLYPQN